MSSNGANENACCAIIRLVPPAGISYVTRQRQEAWLTKVSDKVEPLWISWCGSYGVLVDRVFNDWCGLVFSVNPNNREDARKRLVLCDPHVVRFRAEPDPEWLFVHVVWADSERASYEMAVVDEVLGGMWLYDKRDRVWGYLLEDIQWVLDEYSMRLPPPDRLTVQYDERTGAAIFGVVED